MQHLSEGMWEGCVYCTFSSFWLLSVVLIFGNCGGLISVSHTPGAASIRARFEEAQSRAASSSDNQRGGKKTKSNVEHCADDEVLRMLVRDHLSHKSSTQIFIESKGFCHAVQKVSGTNSHGASHGSVGRCKA